ncbi:MAG TPA: transposase [Phycisphaerales bacterium]|nr:transposase [Phycisphaerales bacterium]HMP36660.1 transposase [Phycisphaerales bacterium]
MSYDRVQKEEARLRAELKAIAAKAEAEPVKTTRLPSPRPLRRRLMTPSGREKRARRTHVVEPAIGWLKKVVGFRQFSLRGEASRGAMRMQVSHRGVHLFGGTHAVRVERTPRA